MAVIYCTHSPFGLPSDRVLLSLSLIPVIIVRYWWTSSSARHNPHSGHMLSFVLRVLLLVPLYFQRLPSVSLYHLAAIGWEQTQLIHSWFPFVLKVFQQKRESSRRRVALRVCRMLTSSHLFEGILSNLRWIIITHIIAREEQLHRDDDDHNDFLLLPILIIIIWSTFDQNADCKLCWW